MESKKLIRITSSEFMDFISKPIDEQSTRAILNSNRLRSLFIEEYNFFSKDSNRHIYITTERSIIFNPVYCFIN